MPKKPVMNPLKDALNVKRGQNIKKSKIAKSEKIPARVSVKSKMPKSFSKRGM